MKAEGKARGAGTGEVILDSALGAIGSDILARTISLMARSHDPAIGSAPQP